MAFASIFVPEFIVQAVVRAEPGLREQAVAIVDGNPPLCRVVAANEKAQRAGIECGMSKLNAGQFTGVEIRARSAAQEKSTHAALLDIGWSVSPRIEDSAPDAIVLDISGLTFLFPSEEAIAARLMELSRECGWTAQVATASDVDTAWIAARGFRGITVIPAGREAEMLGRLPVSHAFSAAGNQRDPASLGHPYLRGAGGVADGGAFGAPGTRRNPPAHAGPRGALEVDGDRGSGKYF
jgi:hypothetical protein